MVGGEGEDGEGTVRGEGMVGVVLVLPPVVVLASTTEVFMACWVLGAGISLVGLGAGDNVNGGIRRL